MTPKLPKPPAVAYPVNEIYRSIQGEGALTGTPMVLVRLQGCAVGCPWCDTKQTWDLNPAHVVTFNLAMVTPDKWTWLQPEALAQVVIERWRPTTWILLTGGEPANYDLAPLVQALHRAGRKVALETSGTATGHLQAGCDWVCVSPKIAMPGGLAVLPEVVAAADEIKHVVGKQEDIDKLDALLTAAAVDPARTRISLQPVSQNVRATELCLRTAEARDWHLSVQMHKYLQVR